MARDLIGVPRRKLARLCFSSILLAAALTACSHPDVKSEEKQILSEINQLYEQSRMHINSEEEREHMIRLNELRPVFPERRDEIAAEAEAVKAYFTRIIVDDKKLAELWRKLLKLQPSDDYRNCVTAQVQVQELTTSRSQNILEEMDLFLDRSITDRQTLDEKLKGIGSRNDEVDQKLSERQSYLAQNCRRPTSQ